jgi:hypothetical protein
LAAKNARKRKEESMKDQKFFMSNKALSPRQGDSSSRFFLRLFAIFVANYFLSLFFVSGCVSSG